MLSLDQSTRNNHSTSFYIVRNQRTDFVNGHKEETWLVNESLPFENYKEESLVKEEDRQKLEEYLSRPFKKETKSEVIVTETKEEIKENRTEIKLWKRLTLFLIGLIGLHILSFFALFMTIGLPKENREALANIITYAMLIVALLAIIFIDIPKQLYRFKKWQPYVFGLLMGGSLIVFTIFYTTVVSNFYKFSVNQNEQGVRSIIDLYPVGSIIILGIVGPVCEELTYRVGLFGSIKKFNKVIAYIVTVLVFAFIHFGFTASNIIDELVNLPIYLFSGFILTFAYDKWGFPGSTLAHITNNMYAVLMNIIFKSNG